MPNGWSNFHGGCSEPPGLMLPVPECNCEDDDELHIICCPTVANPNCTLSCETPVLLKACGGTPPYSWEVDDDFFLEVTPVGEDQALVTVRAAFLQWVYELFYHSWVANPCPGGGDHPGSTIVEIYIRQRNKVYDCDMNLIENNLYTDDAMLFDTDDCCDCSCFDVSSPCHDTDQPLPTSTFATQISFIRNDAIQTARLHSTLGLDYNFNIDGSRPLESIDTFNTGVFAAIPRDAIDVFLFDSADGEDSIAL